MASPTASPYKRSNQSANGPSPAKKVPIHCTLRSVLSKLKHKENAFCKSTAAWATWLTEKNYDMALHDLQEVRSSMSSNFTPVQNNMEQAIRESKQILDDVAAIKKQLRDEQEL